MTDHLVSNPVSVTLEGPRDRSMYQFFTPDRVVVVEPQSGKEPS